MCGTGVSQNLAEELSKRLNVPHYKVIHALDNIISESADMDENVAYNKCFGNKL
jgi:hypothetical protein